MFPSDDEICVSRGTRPGTPQYVQCRKQLDAERKADSARAQAQAQADHERAVAQAKAENDRAMAQAKADNDRHMCIAAHPTNPGGCF